MMRDGIRNPITGSDAMQRVRMDFDNQRLDERTKIRHYLHILFNQGALSEEYRSTEPIKSGSTMIKEVHDYIHRNPGDRDIVETARRYLAEAVPDLDREYLSSGGFFKVHYTLAGSHGVPGEDRNGNGVPDYIELVGEAFDRAKSVTCDARGFRKPLLDAGQNRFQVYVYNLKGKYGITFPSTYFGGNQRKLRLASSYISLDNDFSKDKGFKLESGDCVRVTAAHEFFHAVQNAYNVDADSWWKEASATWNEDEVFRGVNDYLQYLDGFFSAPYNPLEKSSYGGVVFAKYLSDNYDGYNMLKRIWLVQGTRYRDSINAIDHAIREYSAKDGLGSAYGRFAAWNFNPRQYYREGDQWEIKVKLTNTYTGYPVAAQKHTLNHLSAHYQLFRPQFPGSSTLRITLEGAADGKVGFILQKRRSSDDRCEMEEISFKDTMQKVESLCSGLGGSYREVCLIAANGDISGDQGSYTFSAVLQ